jgi:imidazolonepropionase-like amidohydrolase
MFRQTALGGLAAALLASTALADPVAITGVRLIDGTGADPIENAVILIEDGVITAAGADVDPPEGADIRDHAGATVIPGLISAHNHVGMVDGMDAGGHKYTREIIEAELAQYRRYGVTTTTSLGNNPELFLEIREDAQAGRLDGADLYGTYQGIGAPDGAPPIDVTDDQIHRPRTADEARAAVDGMAEAGGDLVKIWMDDLHGDAERLTPEVYTAVIETAHGHGLRVAAHVHDLEEAEAMIAAGADILAHGIRDAEVPAEFAAALAERGTWYIPTLQLDEATFVWADAPDWTGEPFVRAGMHPDLIATVEQEDWREATLGEDGTDRAREALAMNQRNLAILHQAGVPIGFGTDSGATPLRVIGVAEHRELELMVEAGLSPMDALVIATADSARLLNLDDRGTLEPGRRADLVILSGNPLDDIANTRTIIEVWQRGEAASGEIAAQEE